MVQDKTLSPYQAVRFRECPFRDLASILSTTILLAYFGYGGEVRDMMKQLSRKSRAFVKDWDNLRGFIKESKCKPRNYTFQVDFYKSWIPCQQRFSFPDVKELARMRRHEALTGERIILTSIKYTDNESIGLTGIQLFFTCGFKSPFFSAAGAQEEYDGWDGKV